jgi:hypothetical protein
MINIKIIQNEQICFIKQILTLYTFENSSGIFQGRVFYISSHKDSKLRK